MPPRGTNRMPLSAARSGIGARPPLGFGDGNSDGAADGRPKADHDDRGLRPPQATEQAFVSPTGRAPVVSA